MATNSKRVIYIIDDDQDDIDLFREALETFKRPFECRSFTDAQHALDALTADGGPVPDLIFLDLNMPRINGRQCLQGIRGRKALSTVPVVIYSTSSYQKDIDETRELGATRFFTKPSSFSDLREILLVVISEEIAG